MTHLKKNLKTVSVNLDPETYSCRPASFLWQQ